MQTYILLFVFLTLSHVGFSAENKLKTNKELFDQWAGISDPSQGSPLSVGFYSAGCLAGAKKLPLDGTGYSVMRPNRNRYYGHPKLMSFVELLGQKLKNDKLPRLLVGDLSPPRGGPMASGHSSHQVGLDADLWLTMSKQIPSSKSRETMSAPSFVIGRKKLKKTWGQQQIRIVTATAEFDEVQRIFVSPAIKRYFCQKSPQAPWLYKLRAWWGHDEHIHARLTCAADSPLCKAQENLDPADSGCGADLDWWFSKEADEEWAKLSSSTEEKQFPSLPPECEALAK